MKKGSAASKHKLKLDTVLQQLAELKTANTHLKQLK